MVPHLESVGMNLVDRGRRFIARSDIQCLCLAVRWAEQPMKHLAGILNITMVKKGRVYKFCGDTEIPMATNQCSCLFECVGDFGVYSKGSGNVCR